MLIIYHHKILFLTFKIATDMQFEMNHKAGADYSTVTFAHHFPTEGPAIKKLEKLFYKLGGDFQPNVDKEYRWTFPSFITSQVIEQVIHNTCFVCGGLMKNSTAMVDQELEFDHDIYGIVTQKVPGYAKQIKVRKCTACGHSHT